MPTLADIMGLGRENLSECRGLFPKLIGSSKVGGEEPANTPSRVVSPSPRRVLPRKALLGNDEGGDSRPWPRRGGTDDANGPWRAACEMPWLSKDPGSGASKTLRPLAFGDAPKRLSFIGEPKVLLGSSDRGCEAWIYGVGFGRFGTSSCLG